MSGTGVHLPDESGGAGAVVAASHKPRGRGENWFLVKNLFLVNGGRRRREGSILTGPLLLAPGAGGEPLLKVWRGTAQGEKS